MLLNGLKEKIKITPPKENFFVVSWKQFPFNRVNKDDDLWTTRIFDSQIVTPAPEMGTWTTQSNNVFVVFWYFQYNT